MRLPGLLFVVGLLPAMLWGAADAEAAVSIDKGCGNCGRVTGTVTEAGNGLAIANASVSVFTTQGGPPVQVFLSNASGIYDSGLSLPADTYRLVISAPQFVPEMYNDLPCPQGSCNPELAAPVAIAAGSTTLADVVLLRGGSIGGTVLGPGAAPIASAGLMATSMTAPLQYFATSQPDGSYVFDSIMAAGDYTVRVVGGNGLIDEEWPDAPCPAASCDGPVGTPITVAAGAQVTSIDFNLALGGRIAGFVTRASDNAFLQGVPVVIGNADGSVEFFTQSEPDGSFTPATGLPPGDWYAMVLPSAGLLGELWMNIPCGGCELANGTPIPISGTETAHLFFSLNEGATIAGTIDDAITGLPLAGIQVAVYDPGFAAVVASAVTEPDGSYVTSSFNAANVSVTAQGGPYLRSAYGVDCQPLCQVSDGTPIATVSGEQVSGIDISLSRAASLAGRVTTALGAPLVNANINAFVLDGQSVYNGFTDANGDWQLVNLEPGDYIVIAYPESDYLITAWPDRACVFECYYEELDTVALAVGAEVTGVDLVASLGGRVGGTVTDAQSAALLGNVEVTFETTITQTGEQAVSLADGTYVSDPLPAGSYYVYAHSNQGYIDEGHDNVPCVFGCDSADLTVVQVTAGAVTDIDFALQRGGRLGGRITDAGTGNALVGSRPSGYVIDPQGAIVAIARADVAGNWISPGLPAGNYYARSRNLLGFIDEIFDNQTCYWCDVNPGSVIAVTAGNDVTDIDFALLPGARLSGRVTVDDTGLGATEFTIGLYDATGDFVTSSINVDATGNWITNQGLPPGTYYLATASFGRYRDEALGGLPCPDDCDVTIGTPVVVAATAITGLDFVLSNLPIFVSGFEGDAP
jgi:hypothetical protein